MKTLLTIIFIFFNVTIYADTFDISNFKNTNQLVHNNNFKEYISDYFGQIKASYFIKNSTIAKQIKEGLGGPPKKIKKLENNIYMASACRFRSCPEKASIIVDLNRELTIFGIIGYQCTIESTIKYCKNGQLVIFYKKSEEKEALSKYLINWKDRYAPNATVIYKNVI